MGSHALTSDTIGRVISYSLARQPTKASARATGASERAVKGWRAGAIPAAWVRLIHLMRADHELCDAVLAMVGREPIALSEQQRQAVAEALRILEGR